MLLPQLLDTLPGYQDNPNFLTGNKLTLDFDHAHLYRRAQVEVAGGGCSLQGVYALRAEIFDQSASAAESVPVVYVCEAKTEDEANCIHNRVWNIDASAGSLEEVRRIVEQLRRVWPEVEILLWADSGFCRDEIMSWCENQGVDYVFGLAKKRAFRAPDQETDEAGAAAFRQEGQGGPGVRGTRASSRS